MWNVLFHFILNSILHIYIVVAAADVVTLHTDGYASNPTAGSDEAVMNKGTDTLFTEVVTRDGDSCAYYNCGEDSICEGSSPNAYCKSKCFSDLNPCEDGFLCIHPHHLMRIVCLVE